MRSQPSPPAGPGGARAVDAVVGALGLVAEAVAVPGADVRRPAAVVAAEAGRDARRLGGLKTALEALASAAGADLEVAWARLFLPGRGVTAHPYESFYRAGRLADPDVLGELGGLFAAAGVRLRAAGSVDAPDHLGVELELLSLLLRGLAAAGNAEEAKAALVELADALLDDHLAGFVPAFVARLEAAGPPPYFAAIAEVLLVGLAAAREVVRGGGAGGGATRRPEANTTRPLTEGAPSIVKGRPGGGRRRVRCVGSRG